MREALEWRLLRLLERFEPRLPVDDYDSLRSLVEQREWGVGLENLCTQLYEHSLPIAEAELRLIQELAAEMNLPQQVWNFLAED